MSKLKQSLRSSSSFPSFLFALPFSRPLKAQKARPWLSQEPLTVAPASRCNLSPRTPRCSGCCARERDKGHQAPQHQVLKASYRAARLPRGTGASYRSDRRRGTSELPFRRDFPFRTSPPSWDVAPHTSQICLKELLKSLKSFKSLKPSLSLKPSFKNSFELLWGTTCL